MKVDDKTKYTSLLWTPATKSRSLKELKSMWTGSVESKNEVLLLIKSWGINYTTFLRKIQALEEYSNQLTTETCALLKKNPGKHLPSLGNRGKVLAQWLNGRRQAKTGGTDNPFYESDQIIASSLGFPDLFDIIDPEKAYKKKALEYCKWVEKNHGKIPNITSHRFAERQHARFIYSLRGLRENSPRRIATIKILDAAGYGFLLTTLEQKSNEMTHKTCNFILSHNNREPSPRSEDKAERELGLFLTHKRRVQNKEQGVKGKMYPSDLKIAKSYGISDLFKSGHRKELRSNQMCESMCKWVRSHNGNKPRTTAPGVPKEESKYGDWLNYRRQANAGNLGKNAFYQSDLAIVIKYGYGDIFNVPNPERISNEKCTRLCIWIKEHGGRLPRGKFPIHTKKDEIESELGKYLYSRRQANKGKEYGAFYSTDLKIAKSFGYPNVFKTKHSYTQK